MTEGLDHVTVVEVGPRDGLQNEARPVSTQDKAELVRLLLAAGLRRIEVTSFVSPVAVPQLADAAELLGMIDKPPNVELMALVPNAKGMQRALTTGVDRIALFAAATEEFSAANLRCSIDDSFVRFAEVTAMANAASIPVRGYVSVAFDCPFSGPVAATAALRVGLRLRELGCDEIAFADTNGKATPDAVTRLLDAAEGSIPVETVALHVHDTYGNAAENVRAGLRGGVRTFDGAVGGLGGCPFAPGAPGNLATETLVDALEAAGWATGIDRAALDGASRFVRQITGRTSA